MSDGDTETTQVATVTVPGVGRDALAMPPPRLPSTPVPARGGLARFELRVVERARRLGLAGAAGIAALIFCIAFLQSTLLPKLAQVRDLRAAADVLASAPAAVQAAAPRIGAREFVASLPDRDALPAILGAIVQQAQSAGLSLDRGAYQWSADKSGAVARYQLAMPVTGSYPAVRHFVEATLVAVPAAALSGISIERPNVGDGAVSANLRFEIYVRNTP